MARSIKLTADWFQQIVATLKSDTHQVKGHEKRTEGRVGLRCMLDLVPRVTAGNSGKPGGGGATPGAKGIGLAVAAGKPITAWVRDISVNGIGLVCSRPVEAGIELVAKFDRHGLPPLAVVYKVRYVRRLSADLYSIGANLKTVINGDAPPEKEKPKPVEARAAEAPVAVAVAVEDSPVQG